MFDLDMFQNVDKIEFNIYVDDDNAVKLYDMNVFLNEFEFFPSELQKPHIVQFVSNCVKFLNIGAGSYRYDFFKKTLCKFEKVTREGNSLTFEPLSDLLPIALIDKKGWWKIVDNNQMHRIVFSENEQKQSLYEESFNIIQLAYKLGWQTLKRDDYYYIISPSQEVSTQAYFLLRDAEKAIEHNVTHLKV